MSAVQPVKLLVGRAVLDATAPGTRAAVEQWNEKQRSAAIPDEFNPAVIDIRKFDAMVAALGPDSAAVIGGRPMALDTRRLGIGASSPTTPGSFKAPLALHVVREHTDSVSVQADFIIDCDLAKARANAARAMTHEAEGAVQAAEARHDSGTDARVRRWAVARVWEENAIAAAACTPGDDELVEDSEAATKATDAAVLLGGSMQ